MILCRAARGKLGGRSVAPARLPGWLWSHYSYCSPRSPRRSPSRACRR